MGLLKGKDTHQFLKFGVSAPLDERVGETQRAALLLVLVREVHRGEQRERLMLWLHARDSEIRRQLQTALLDLLREGAEVGLFTHQLPALQLNRHCQYVLRRLRDGGLRLRHLRGRAQRVDHEQV